MARYLVGGSPDTWDFYDAYNAADNGDVIEFQKDYVYEIPEGKYFEITKDLTICGDVKIQENGERHLSSCFRGSFWIDKAKVVFENIVLVRNSNLSLAFIDYKSEVVFKNSILSTDYNEPEYFLVVYNKLCKHKKE